MLAAVSGWGGFLCWKDGTERRLPNWVTIGGLLVALVFRLGYGRVGAFLDGFAGAAIGGVFLLFPFLMHGAGGGDVKMMAASGAMVGMSRILDLLWITSISGLIVGVILLIAGKMDGSRMKHVIRCAFDWRYDRKAGAAGLPAKESEKVRMPFSVPILIGTLAALV